MTKTVSKKKKLTFKEYVKKNYKGWLFVSPVILGIIIFTLLPMFTSLYDSFFKYDGLSERIWNNFKNYTKPFQSGWYDFGKALHVTFVYSLINIPLTLILSYLLAVLLCKKIKGIKVFRAIYYLPCVIPAVISGLLWRNILDVQYGLANSIVTKLGFEPLTFLTSSKTALPSLIFTNLFGLGGGMILWIATLNGISKEMYESASLDGAGKLRQFFTITIPLSSPVIFYNLIMGIIGSLQTFGNIVTLTGGSAGPDNSLLFYVMNIYNVAFSNSPNIGYASALSWILFAIIGVFTIIVFKTSKWVFYGDEN